MKGKKMTMAVGAASALGLIAVAKKRKDNREKRALKLIQDGCRLLRKEQEQRIDKGNTSLMLDRREAELEGYVRSIESFSYAIKAMQDFNYTSGRGIAECVKRCSTEMRNLAVTHPGIVGCSKAKEYHRGILSVDAESYEENVSKPINKSCRMSPYYDCCRGSIKLMIDSGDTNALEEYIDECSEVLAELNGSTKESWKSMLLDVENELASREDFPWIYDSVYGSVELNKCKKDTDDAIKNLNNIRMSLSKGTPLKTYISEAMNVINLMNIFKDMLVEEIKKDYGSLSNYAKENDVTLGKKYTSNGDAEV